MPRDFLPKSRRNPDFDIDQAIGSQSELWVSDIIRLMKENNGAIEVKAPKPFLASESFYVEYRCRSRSGEWHPSGIATTKAKAFVFTFGSLPGGLIIDTEWLKRAGRLAFNEKSVKECVRGSNPTKAVVVTLRHLWLTRDREP